MYRTFTDFEFFCRGAHRGAGFDNIFAEDYAPFSVWWKIHIVYRTFVGFAKIYDFKHIDKNGNIINNSIIKTSDKFNININGEKDYIYSLSLLGDVNGDGKINSMDYVKIRKHIMQTENISDKVYYYAADVNSDNKISSADYVKIKKYIMNGGTLWKK